MHTTDFIVIGAGIAGASVAAELAAKHSVILLEAEAQPGYHATGRSAALFSEMYGNRIIRSVTRASREALFEPRTDFAAHPLTRRRGALYVATAGQMPILNELAMQGDLRALVREVDAVSARSLCSSLRSSYVFGGLYEPGAADIDVHALHQAYLRAFRTHGGFLHKSQRVDAIEWTDGRWLAHSATDDYAAPTLINAAGAWADQVASLAGARPLGLRALRRTAVLVDAPQCQSISDWPLVLAADESFYFKPDAGRLLISPGDETPMEPCDVQPEEWDVALAIDRLTTATDIVVERVGQRWAGLRTFAVDRTPVVGFDPRAAGFFWLAGQGGYGVQTAPALARIAAALACDRHIPQAITDFGVDAAQLSPRRFDFAA